MFNELVNAYTLYLENESCVTQNVIKTLSHAIKHDVITAFEKSQPLISQHALLFASSSSFFDFLLRLMNVNLNRPPSQPPPFIPPPQSPSSDNDDDDGNDSFKNALKMASSLLNIAIRGDNDQAYLNFIQDMLQFIRNQDNHLKALQELYDQCMASNEMDIDTKSLQETTGSQATTSQHLEQLHNDLVNCQSNLEDCKFEMNELEKRNQREINRLNETIANLDKDLLESGRKNDKLSSQFETLKRELEQKKRDAQSSSKEFNYTHAECTEQLNKMKADYESKLEKINADFEECQAGIVKYDYKCSMCESKIEELKKKHRTKIDRLVSEKSALEQELRDAGKTYDELASKHHSSKAEFGKLQVKLAACENDVAYYKEFATDCENSLAEKTREKREEITKLYKQMDDIKQESDDRYIDVQSKLDECEAISLDANLRHKTQLEQWNRERNQLNQDLKTASDKFRTLNAKYDKNKKHLQDIQSQLTACQTQLRYFESHSSSSSSSNYDDMQKLKHETEIERLENQIEDDKTESSNRYLELSSQLDTCRLNLREYQGKVEKLNKKLTKREMDQTKTETELQKCQRKLTIANERLESLGVTHQTQSNELHDLQIRYKTCQSDLERLEIYNKPVGIDEECQEKLIQMKDSYSKLARELQTQYQQNYVPLAAYNDLQSKLRDCEAKRETLKTAFRDYKLEHPTSNETYANLHGKYETSKLDFENCNRELNMCKSKLRRPVRIQSDDDEDMENHEEPISNWEYGQSDLQALALSDEKLKHENKELQHENKELKHKHVELKQEIVELQKQHSERVRELNREIVSLEEKLGALMETTDEKGETESISLYKDLKKDYGECRSELSVLQTEVVSLRTDRDTLAQKNIDLQNLYVDIKKQLDACEKNVKAMRMNMKSGSEEYTALALKHHATIKDGQAFLDQLQKEKNELETEKNELLERYNREKDVWLTSYGNENQLISEYNRLKTAAEELNRQHKELKAKHKELNHQHKELNRQHEELKTKHEELKTKQQELKTAKEDELKTVRDESQRTYDELQKKQIELTARHEKIQDDSKLLYQILEETLYKLADMTEPLVDQQNVNKNLYSKLKKIKTDNELCGLLQNYVLYTLQNSIERQQPADSSLYRKFPNIPEEILQFVGAILNNIKSYTRKIKQAPKEPSSTSRESSTASKLKVSSSKALASKALASKAPASKAPVSSSDAPVSSSDAAKLKVSSSDATVSSSKASTSDLTTSTKRERPLNTIDSEDYEDENEKDKRKKLSKKL